MASITPETRWIRDDQVPLIYVVEPSQFMVKLIKSGNQQSIHVIAGRDGHVFYTEVLLEQILNLQKREL